MHALHDVAGLEVAHSIPGLCLIFSLCQVINGELMRLALQEVQAGPIFFHCGRSLWCKQILEHWYFVLLPGQGWKAHAPCSFKRYKLRPSCLIAAGACSASQSHITNTQSQKQNQCPARARDKPGIARELCRSECKTAIAMKIFHHLVVARWLGRCRSRISLLGCTFFPASSGLALLPGHTTS